ncbi:MAG: Hsp20/alpha crystallin family protein [Promethearchaeota archaeon]
MVLDRWQPTRRLPWRLFRELDETGRQFDSLFETALWPAIWRRLPTQEREWSPAIEVFEKEDKYVVKAEIPGLKEEDVEISVNDDVLTLKGEKKTEYEVKEEEYHWSERTYGSFLRTIRLPSNVEAEKIEAEYENGMMEITLPKMAEVKPKKIMVKPKKGEKTSK